jgi:enoyl-CoA hydratase
MQPNDKITVTISGGIAHLLLNKPEKLNALDEEMLLEIEQSFATWESNPAIVVVVLASTSERAFCVGADIEVLSHFNGQSMQAWEMLGNRVLDRIELSPLISVASIAGQALGGGLTLATACDFRIASAHANFGQPEINLGWVPGWGGVTRLASLIGTARAKDLCMNGHQITGSEAAAIGLIDRFTKPDDFPLKADIFAKELSQKSRDALRGIKALANASRSRAAAHHFDALLNATLLNNECGQKAIARFLARKK